MLELGILGAGTGGLLVLGAAEYVGHRRQLARIPTRIHVSGTRGKSSVTRLIASALRHAGISTLAKTTGTLARVILPDGSEAPIFRPRGANIMEQKRVVALAARLGAQALVIECMALQPALHWLSENKLVRATHGVITNARADHLDVMGPGEEDVARCLAGMIPVKGKLFTAERRHIGILSEAAQDRGTALFQATEEDDAAITDEEMTHFLYTEHKENVGLVLRITESLGVPREVALAGMWQTRPDPGALSFHDLDFFGRRIVFANAFAANDPESTERVWRMARARYPEIEHSVVVFNMRADRPHRTVQLAQDTTFWHDAGAVVLIGTGAYQFGRHAEKLWRGEGDFIYSESERTEDIFEQIVGVCKRASLVVGVGNIGGPGLGLVRFFRNRARTEGEV